MMMMIDDNPFVMNTTVAGPPGLVYPLPSRRTRKTGCSRLLSFSYRTLPSMPARPPPPAPPPPLLPVPHSRSLALSARSGSLLSLSLPHNTILASVFFPPLICFPLGDRRLSGWRLCWRTCGVVWLDVRQLSDGRSRCHTRGKGRAGEQ